MTWWNMRCDQGVLGRICKNRAVYVIITGDDMDDRELACGLHARTRGTEKGLPVKRVAW